MTLKEIREHHGLTQGQISQITGINIPTLSNYETGSVKPTIEDAILIEQEFNQVLDWQDNIDPQSREVILSSINKLATRYPISSVFTFATRALKQDERTGRPYSTIRFWAEKMMSKEILLPPNFKENEEFG